AGAGLELLAAVEEQGAAAGAGIAAGLEDAAHLRAERTLRGGLAGDAVDVGGELRAPLLVGLLDAPRRRQVAVSSEPQHLGPVQHDFLRVFHRAPGRNAKSDCLLVAADQRARLEAVERAAVG